MNKTIKNKELHRKLKIEYQSYMQYCKKSLKYSKKSKEPYFVMYCNFKKLISNISNDALKLYLYLGFNIDYKKGFLIKDEHTICKDINFKENKMNTCLRELKRKNLIYIKKDNNDNEFIFIIPYDLDNKSNYSIVDLEEIYKTWIKTSKESIEPFFIILKKFMDYWCFLSSGSIKLYIYFGIYMDKKKGFFYRSLDTISNDLNVSKRSISKWFKELEERNLVKRQQLFLNKSSCTYMIPLIDIKNQSTYNTSSLENSRSNEKLFQNLSITPNNLDSENNNKGF